MKIGFIGLGHMGSGMAANLLKAGHEVTVYNRTTGKVQALVEQGAHGAAQVADACRGDAVITMLADDGVFESVVFGDQGVIGSLRKERDADEEFTLFAMSCLIAPPFRCACSVAQIWFCHKVTNNRLLYKPNALLILRRMQEGG
jgi:hypothetical protein